MAFAWTQVFPQISHLLFGRPLLGLCRLGLGLCLRLGLGPRGWRRVIRITFIFTRFVAGSSQKGPRRNSNANQWGGLDGSNWIIHILIFGWSLLQLDCVCDSYSLSSVLGMGFSTGGFAAPGPTFFTWDSEPPVLVLINSALKLPWHRISATSNFSWISSNSLGAEMK